MLKHVITQQSRNVKNYYNLRQNFISRNDFRTDGTQCSSFFIHITVGRPVDWLQVGFIAVKLGSAAGYKSRYVFYVRRKHLKRRC